MENDLAYFDVQTITKSSKRGGAELAEDIAEFLALPQGEVASGRHGPWGEQGPPPGDLPLRVPWTKGGKTPPLRDAHSPASWLGQAVASHRTQWIKNPRIYHSSHLALRLCVFARGNLYTTAPLTAAASLPIHSSRLRVFSRKGAKAQSFSELRNSEFLATRYVGDCYISNAVPDPDAPVPSIISASPSVTSAPLRFVEFRPQGDGQPPESTRLPVPKTCATGSQATCQPARLARALATRGLPSQTTQHSLDN